MGKKKGGKVQGRAKQKQKAQKSSPGGKAPWMKAFAKSFDDNENSNTMFRGFAQQSADDGPRPGGPPQKLRHQTISFVSAGSSTPKPAEEDGNEGMVADKDKYEDEDDEDDREGDNFDDSIAQTSAATNTEADIAQGTEAMHIHENSRMPDTHAIADTRVNMDVTAASQPEPLSFVVDTVGDPSLSRSHKGKAKVPIRASSPTPSDSSEEVILFHGRNRPTTFDDPVSNTRTQATPPTRKATPQQPLHALAQKPDNSHITDDLLAALGVSPGQWAPKPQPTPKYVEATEGFTPAPEGSWWRRPAPRPDLGPSAEERELLDQAAAAAPRATRVGFAEPQGEQDAESTIASLQSDWKDVRREKKREHMQEAHTRSHANEKVKLQPRTTVVNESGSSNRRGKRGRKRNNKLLRALEEDESDDSEAAYNDYMENLKTQLDAGTLEGVSDPAGQGPSLVIDGEPIADDEVLDAGAEDVDVSNARKIFESDSDSDSESDIIGQDIEELEDSLNGMNASDYDSSDLEDELEEDEREMWEDEEDIRQRRHDAMDDEHIARLFAKQIEYGIDDDELVLDDGVFMDEIDAGIGDIDEAKAGLDRLVETSFGQPKSKSKDKGKGKNSKGFSFPDASALADSIEQYGDNGFDIMDFERPSLRQKPKGRKNKTGLPPELDDLSDEDLKDEMLNTWTADRAKKRLKKAEREDLRAQGLLGAAGRNGKADLNQKFLQGMTIVQIHEELRAFLLDEGKTTRAFPPMDTDDRRALHEVANALNLKSKSVGKGNHRAPVLYKTSRTLDYEEATFARISRASQRGYYKNSSYKPKRATGGPKGMKGGKGAGAAMGAVGLRHGEIVGAGAKAIGNESFGHRLMEKMGWQKGAGLGREGEGMVVPVQQVMRTGKTGLG